MDPCLYGLVYDKTLVSSAGDAPQLCPPPNTDTTSAMFGVSRRFSYIATPFTISSVQEPPRAVAQSYINNIDPDNQVLYEDIQVLLAKCIPLFEHVLTDLHRNSPLRQRITGTYAYTVWDEPDEPEESDDEQAWQEFHLIMAHWSLNRPISLPDVPREGFVHKPKSSFMVSLRGRTVKVIVRVSKLRLVSCTLSMSFRQITHIIQYSGGVVFHKTPWHVEGMRNDHIVACALYCTEMVGVFDPLFMTDHY